MAQYEQKIRSNKFLVDSAQRLVDDLRSYGVDASISAGPEGIDGDQVVVVVSQAADHHDQVEVFACIAPTFEHDVVHSRLLEMGDERASRLSIEDVSRMDPFDVFDALGITDHSVTFESLISSRMAPGEVAVFMSVGTEGWSLLSGTAVAYTRHSQVLRIALDDIYELAAQKLGADFISPCEA